MIRWIAYILIFVGVLFLLINGWFVWSGIASEKDHGIFPATILDAHAEFHRGTMNKIYSLTYTTPHGVDTITFTKNVTLVDPMPTREELMRDRFYVYYNVTKPKEIARNHALITNDPSVPETSYSGILSALLIINLGVMITWYARRNDTQKL
jgi:hypothetical protein